MTRFQVVTEKREGHTVYVLRDLHDKSVARIVPSLGANCLELALSPADGVPPVPVINDLDFITKTSEQASRYGIPILFPWPSGIPSGTFDFQGKIIELNPPGEKRATHHGFVNTAAWRVVRSDCDNTSAWLTCAVRSQDCGEKGKRFPFSFTLEVTWRLADSGFSMTMEATNTGDGPMPMGLGLHPYFTIPFGKQGAPGNCRLFTAIEKQWDLDKIIEVNPGENAPTDAFLDNPAFDPSSGGGRPIEKTKFNHVYQAAFDNSFTRSVLSDPDSNLRLTVMADKDFSTWVIYTPPDRAVISLEPWTMTPNAFNLAAAGMKNTGIITLESQKTWSGTVSFQLSNYSPESKKTNI